MLESTTYPGTTDDVIKPILEETGLQSKIDFFLGFSPEREDPGNRSFEVATIPKVVAGDGIEAATLVRLSPKRGQTVPVSSITPKGRRRKTSPLVNIASSTS